MFEEVVFKVFLNNNLISFVQKSNVIMKVDLIIFDLDGTLVNSIPDLTNAINYVAKKNNLHVFNEIEISELVGGGVSRLIESAFNISSDETGFADYFNLFLNYYGSNHSNNSYLYDDVLDVLEHFKTKKLAILSNKLHVFTKQMVKDYKIDNYFDIVLGATDKLKKKPSAEPINYILQKLKISHNAAVIVGDSEPDIITAKKSGIYSIAVTYGYRSRTQLEQHKPDFIIDELTELKKIIE